MFFDVGVPILRQSMVWSLRTMLGQDRQARQRRARGAEADREGRSIRARRSAIENAIARLELQLGPAPGQRDQASLTRPSPATPPSARRCPASAAATVAPAARRRHRRRRRRRSRRQAHRLQDPNAINRAYTESVQRALIDAMIDYSLPMAHRPRRMADGRRARQHAARQPGAAGSVRRDRHDSAAHQGLGSGGVSRRRRSIATRSEAGAGAGVLEFWAGTGFGSRRVLEPWNFERVRCRTMTP